MKKHLILWIAAVLTVLTASVGLAEYFDPVEPGFQTEMPEFTDFFSPGSVVSGMLYYAKQNCDYREVFIPGEDGVYSFYLRNFEKPGSWHTHYGFYDQYERGIEGLPRDIAVEGIAPHIEQFTLKAGVAYHINLWAHETNFCFAICSPSRHTGDLSAFEVIQEATCGNAGYQSQRCLLCGGEVNRTEIPVIEHVPGEEIIAKVPTCTRNGESYIRCAVCGMEISRQIILSTGHTFGEEQVIQEASCLSKGVSGVKCVTCGTVLTQHEIPITDHVPSAWVDLKPVTCTTDGLRTQRCAVCGETLKTETISAFGHIPSEWQVTREPTCRQNGLREIKCSLCGASLEQEEMAPLDHEYSEWEVTKEATAEEEGEKTRYCIYCGEAQVESTPKLLKVMRVVY